MIPLTPPFPRREEAGSLNGPVSALPLLDQIVLRSLEEQLGGDVLVLNLVRDYAEMWKSRYEKLADGLQRPDAPEAALDAVISLRVSSSMVGALRLAAMAATVEAFIKTDLFPHGTAQLALVEECGFYTGKGRQAVAF